MSNLLTQLPFLEPLVKMSFYLDRIVYLLCRVVYKKITEQIFKNTQQFLSESIVDNAVFFSALVSDLGGINYGTATVHPQYCICINPSI